MTKSSYMYNTQHTGTCRVKDASNRKLHPFYWRTTTTIPTFINSQKQKKKKNEKDKNNILNMTHQKIREEKILRNDLVCQGACAQTGSIVHFRSPTHRPRELNPLFILFSYSHLSLCVYIAPPFFPRFILCRVYISMWCWFLVELYFYLKRKSGTFHMKCWQPRQTHKKETGRIRLTISFSPSR